MSYFRCACVVIGILLSASCSAAAPAATPAPMTASPPPAATLPPATPISVTTAPSVATAPPTVASIAPASSVALDPASVDPCALLTATRVGEVLGETVTAGVLTESEDRATCFFDVPAWPVPITIPEDSGVRLEVWREPQTVANHDPFPVHDQLVVEQVSGVGDAAWWYVHVEAPNLHLDSDNGILDVVAEPIQFRITFLQIPNPTGTDKSAWLADATTLANDVLAVLGG